MSQEESPSPSTGVCVVAEPEQSHAGKDKVGAAWQPAGFRLLFLRVPALGDLPRRAGQEPGAGGSAIASQTIVPSSLGVPPNSLRSLSCFLFMLPLYGWSRPGPTEAQGHAGTWPRGLFSSLCPWAPRGSVPEDRESGWAWPRCPQRVGFSRGGRDWDEERSDLH